MSRWLVIIGLVGCENPGPFAGFVDARASDASSDGSVDAYVHIGPLDAAGAGADAQPELSSSKAITSFGFTAADNPSLSADLIGVFAGNAIGVAVPRWTPAFSLRASFSTSGQGVYIGGVQQISDVSMNDFSLPQKYTVVAVDNSTADYTVSILDPAFRSAQSFSTGSYPYPIAVADFNGDGKPDIVVGDSGSTTTTILLNTTSRGSTTVSFSRSDLSLGSNQVSAVNVADLNGDGKPDLIAYSDILGMVSVFMNTSPTAASAPSFSARADFVSGDLNYISVADINRDGKLDLVVSNFGANTVSVLLNVTAANASSASFAPPTSFGTGTFPYAIAIGDLNGDGAPDLAVANVNSNTVSILLSATPIGSATVSMASSTQLAVAALPQGIVAVDLNRDGLLDLAVVSDSIVSVFLNTTAASASTPTFAPRVDLATSGSSVGITAGDLDGDLKPDLVVTNVTGSLSVFRNLTATNASSLSLAERCDFPVPTPYRVAIADFNGDGKPDLSTTTYGSDTVAVLVAQ